MKLNDLFVTWFSSIHLSSKCTLMVLLAWTDSTFSFLLEQWKNKLPQDLIVKKAHVDHPFEEDPCHCHFSFTNKCDEGELVLKYQWFIGGKTPTDFVPLPEELSEVEHSFDLLEHTFNCT